MAVSSVSPSARNQIGSTISASAPIHSGRCLWLDEIDAHSKRLDALAEQAARAEHQHEEHQHVH